MVVWRKWIYLLTATVRASGELTHGQMTSDLNPKLWNTFRNASHDEIDPKNKSGKKSEKRDRLSIHLMVWVLQDISELTLPHNVPTDTHTHMDLLHQQPEAYGESSGWCHSDLCVLSEPSEDLYSSHTPL